MSTIDIAEVRRQLENYTARQLSSAYPPTGLVMTLLADRLLAYLPMLLDELEQLRAAVLKERDFE